MKAYTDIEQSRKLAEILPVESADMYWWPTSIRYYIDANEDDDFNEEEGHIRAWSLAALEEILDGASFTKCGTAPESYEATIFYNDEPHAVLKRMTCTGTSYVDACYEMILKLHEQGYELKY